jgi:hypothetical protein
VDTAKTMGTSTLTSASLDIPEVRDVQNVNTYENLVMLVLITASGL